MSTPIRTMIALGEAADRDTIAGASLAAPDISIAGFLPADAKTVPSLSQYPYDALVVACAQESEDVLRFIEGARQARPERPVIVLYEGEANGFVRRAFEAGADDLVSGPVVSGSPMRGEVARDVTFALEKAVARRAGLAAPSNGRPRATMGSMVTVLGAKGGTGKTLTACNLAVALAHAGERVVLADVDLQFGDVGLVLGMSPERTVYELATSGGSLDAEKLDDYLMRHSSGLRVLMAPRRPDQAGAVGVEFLRELLGRLREMSDHVIVDTPPGFSPDVIAAIDRSSDVCVVTTLDTPSLKNTKLALETLELMEYDRSHIKVVLNRADSRVGVTVEDVTALLGRAPDVLVPSHRDITRSVNEALPIVLSTSNPDARRAFETLAAGYRDGGAQLEADQPKTTQKSKRRGLLRRSTSGA